VLQRLVGADHARKPSSAPSIVARASFHAMRRRSAQSRRARAVWYADVGNKRCVRVREGGEVLNIVECDRGCFACMLGGADGGTLFIVAQEWSGPQPQQGARSGQLLAVKAPTPHAGRP
jgi:hypothetical protein